MKKHHYLAAVYVIARLRRIAVHLGVAVAALLPAAAPAADPTPKELAAQLRETLTGLGTLEMHYRRTTVLARDGVPRVNDCEWCRDGVKQRLCVHPGGRAEALASFDGRHGYSVWFRKGRPDVPDCILKEIVPPETLDLEMPPSYYLGLRVKPLEKTLLDLLEGEQARIIGSEVRDGLTVHLVDLGVHKFGSHEYRSRNPWRWTATLCPERDGLPVEIGMAPAEDHPNPQKALHVIGAPRFLVTEFFEVEDRELDRRWWLPRAMRYDSSRVTETLDVTFARVNHAVPASIFVLKPQPGTHIVDETVPGKRTHRIYRPEAALRQRAPELAKAVAPPANGAATAAAPPDPGRWWRLARWAGVLALLAGAVVYVIRSRRTG